MESEDHEAGGESQEKDEAGVQSSEEPKAEPVNRMRVASWRRRTSRR